MKSGDAGAPLHPVCCPCSGQRAATQHRAPARRTRTTHGQTERDQNGVKHQKRRETEACVGAGQRSILLVDSHARLAQGPRTRMHTRMHTHAHAPPAPQRPVVCAPEPAHAPSVRSIAARCTQATPTDAQPARTGSGQRRPGARGRGHRAGGAGRAPLGSRGRSSGVHLRGPGAGRRRGPGAPAAAASCAGAKTLPGRGSRTEEATGCRDQAGRGFIAEPRREGAPTAG